MKKQMVNKDPVGLPFVEILDRPQVLSVKKLINIWRIVIKDRHQMWLKFPDFWINDFSLMKIKFPWPNKYKISDICSGPQPPLPKHNSTEITLTWTFQLSMALNQWCYNYNFPWSQFSLTQNKIPWLFFYFPRPFSDLWQPCPPQG